MKDRGLNKSGLAKLLNVQASTVGRWLDQDVQAEPGFEMLGRLANVLKCDEFEFFIDSDVPPNPQAPTNSKTRAMYALMVLEAELRSVAESE